MMAWSISGSDRVTTTQRHGIAPPLSEFLVPLRATLTVSLPAKPLGHLARAAANALGGGGGGGGGGGAEIEEDSAAAASAERKAAEAHDPFPMSGMRIERFDDEVQVYPSKAKPKKITLRTTSGARVRARRARSRSRAPPRRAPRRRARRLRLPRW